MIHNMSNNPILLEGDTGIGKSVSVEIAAKMSGKKLIRFNMSAKLTIDDFLGKILIVKEVKTEKKKFELQLGPFSFAFKNGYWLLLDEMNLAPDNVLQCIENALDNKVLMINDFSNSQEPSIKMQMHKDFRLFGTQNPNVGYFKGKREKLSFSLIDRFTLIYFKELSNEEWIEIITQRLINKNFDKESSEVLSKKMIENVHFNIQNEIKQSTFTEKTAYSTLSIREVLKWCDSILNLNSIDSISFSAFMIYGSRFRKDENQKIILNKLKTELSDPKLDVKDFRILSNELIFDDIKFEINRKKITSDNFDVSLFSQTEKHVFNKIILFHNNLLNECFSDEFVRKHGLHIIEIDLLNECFKMLNKSNLGSEEKLTNILNIYANCFRHGEVRTCVQKIFKKIFPDYICEYNETNFEPSNCLRPFVITKRVLKLWKQMCWCLKISYPILITGNEGCGKSEAVYFLSKLCGFDLDQVCLTPETEIASLVGEYSPNTSNDGKIRWIDGYVTRSFKKGKWLLLDNINQADACVIERLNPILENKPTWILSEKGEVDSIQKQKNFKIFSTMTTSSSKNDPKYKELSPAVFNRYSIISMETLDFSDKKNFDEEIKLFIEGFFELNTEQVSILLDICWDIYTETSNKHKSEEYGIVTQRNLIRFLDVCFILSNKKHLKSHDFNSFIMKSYLICFESQFKSRTCSNLHSRIETKLNNPQKVNLKDFYQLNDRFVLKKTRENILETVLACIECKIPILLEGPTAVGKTSMVSWLSETKLFKNKPLLRINNNESTTIQDYIGTFLPIGNGFIFNKGVLLKALEDGHWFLADEFNLADPAIMNMLFPLLEGKKTVEFVGLPEKMLRINSNFHFFATQNPKYFGRNELSSSLRNRFQVNDFSEDELISIIRNKSNLINEEDARKISQLHLELKGEGYLISMRDIIKWIKRYEVTNRKGNESSVLGIYTYGLTLLTGSYFDEQKIDYLKSLILKKWEISENYEEKANVVSNGNTCFFYLDKLMVSFNDCILNRSFLFENDKRPPGNFVTNLVILCFAVKNKEPLLLEKVLIFCLKYILNNGQKLIYRIQSLIENRNKAQTSEIYDKLQELKGIFDDNFDCDNKLNIHNIIEKMESDSKLDDDKYEQNFEDNENDFFDDGYDIDILNESNENNIKAESSSLIDDKESFSIDGIEHNENYFFDDGYDIDILNESNENNFKAESSSLIDDKKSFSIDDPNLNKLRFSESVLNNEEFIKNRKFQEYIFPKRDGTSKKYENKEFFNLKEIFEKMMFCQDYFTLNLHDKSVESYLDKIMTCIEKLLDLKDKDKTIFLFNDGPIVEAIKLGKIVLLEDLDLPSQAVVERLNSLLETEPSFSLPEDITNSYDLGTNISDGFQIFATVCQENENQKMKISPAIRSRFTEIRVTQYSDSNMETLVSNLKLPEENKMETIQKIIKIRELIIKENDWPLKNDIHILFKWFDFLEKRNDETSDINYKILLGAKFFYLEKFKYTKKDNIYDRFKKLFENWWHFFQSEKPIPKKYLDILKKPQDNEVETPFLLIDKENSIIKLQYNQIELKLCNNKKYESDKQISECFYLKPTETLIIQICRILISITTESALLLVGPPGVGKTSVVAQVCKILNTEYERINFSLNTTIEQLFGSIVPQLVKGKREFIWRDGIITKAIKNRKWILLDEINLATSEVLQQLARLVDRNNEHFIVPVSHEKICLKEIRFFATMNPAIIGGGRNKLPRSIENMFVSVKLEEFDQEEMFSIVLDLFYEAIQRKFVTVDQLKTIFQLHFDIKENYIQRKIGRHGGPYEFNLRELIKFRDLLINNAEDQILHHSLFTNKNKCFEKNIGTEREGELITNTFSIKKFFQIVYSSQFHLSIDQEIAKKIINQRLNIDVKNEIIDIDYTLRESLNIGSIYMPKGNYHSQKSYSLIHSKKTLEQLELLAAATQSKRSILIEGDTCSRKTCLVQELARLTNNKLIHISLNQETEISTLIGQWAPEKKAESLSNLKTKISELLDEIFKNFVLFFFNRRKITMDETDNLKLLMNEKERIFKNDSIDDLITLLGSFVKEIEQLLQKMKTSINSKFFKYVNSIFNRFISQLERFTEKLNQQKNSSDEICFTFVESKFIRAIKEGHWVLLDNVNSAPPEIIERLNSLLEEKPSLNIYEYHDGEELSRDNKKISENFRLFFTSNSKRTSTYKFSSAFLNRVIRLWFSGIDENIAQEKNEEYDFCDIEQTDLFELTKNLFNCEKVAFLVVVFHLKYKSIMKNKANQLCNDQTLSKITFRKIKKTSEIFSKNSNSNENLSKALFDSLYQNYFLSIRSSQVKKLLLDTLINIVNKCSENSTPFKEVKKHNLPDNRSIIDLFKEKMVNIEISLSNLVLNFFLRIETGNKKSLNTKFLEYIKLIVVGINKTRLDATFDIEKIISDEKNKLKTNNGTQLNQIFERISNSSVNREIVGFKRIDNLKNEIEIIIRIINEIKIIIFNLFEMVSIEGASNLKAILKKLFKIFETFIGMITDLSQHVDNIYTDQIQNLITSLDKVLILNQMLSWFYLFETKNLLESIENLKKKFNDENQRTNLFLLEKKLNYPLVSNLKNTFLVKNCDVIKFQFCYEWTCLFWTFYNSIPKALIIYPSNISIFNNLNIQKFHYLNYSIYTSEILIEIIKNHKIFLLENLKNLENLNDKIEEAKNHLQSLNEYPEYLTKPQDDINKYNSDIEQFESERNKIYKSHNELNNDLFKKLEELKSEKQYLYLKRLKFKGKLKAFSNILNYLKLNSLVYDFGFYLNFFYNEFLNLISTQSNLIEDKIFLYSLGSFFRFDIETQVLKENNATSK
ncbi:unnamed protein product [Brachionus calyciflorus]|uniref:Midasin n=1 Tax=Brachionus calyciflorus TaxID=104777 RepID=A0A814AJX7_9BILA|nr:unnamed protein product [Brachionus calyciflorus]